VNERSFTTILPVLECNVNNTVLALMWLDCAQVAPLLGIIGRPLTDAAAAAECFEGESMPTPPSALASAAAVASGCQQLTKACTPGLLMPEIETLLPSDNARHTYEMQVSNCQRVIDNAGVGGFSWRYCVGSLCVFVTIMQS
jgi:hypothetical protein